MKHNSIELKIIFQQKKIINSNLKKYLEIQIRNARNNYFKD